MPLVFPQGWEIAGTDDLELLAEKPELFSAVRAGGYKLTLQLYNIVEPLTITTPPVDKVEQVVEKYEGLTEWRLIYNGYFVARGRSLEQILQKAIRLMEQL